MGGLLVQLCLGGGILFLSLIGITFGLFLHNLPQIGKFLVALIRNLFMFSYRFYHILLTHLEPFFTETFGIQTTTNPYRTFLTGCFSFLLGCLICLIFQWPIQVWFLGVLALHGSFIGIAWQDFFEPVGLRLGMEE